MKNFFLIIWKRLKKRWFFFENSHFFEDFFGNRTIPGTALIETALTGESLYLHKIQLPFSRDTLDWVKAVDLMRKLRPKILVPQHTRPIEGQDEISEILTAYRWFFFRPYDLTFYHTNQFEYMLKVFSIYLYYYCIKSPLSICYYEIWQFFGCQVSNSYQILYQNMLWKRFTCSETAFNLYMIRQ